MPEEEKENEGHGRHVAPRRSPESSSRFPSNDGRSRPSPTRSTSRPSFPRSAAWDHERSVASRRVDAVRAYVQIDRRPSWQCRILCGRRALSLLNGARYDGTSTPSSISRARFLPVKPDVAPPKVDAERFRQNLNASAKSCRRSYRSVLEDLPQPVPAHRSPRRRADPLHRRLACRTGSGDAFAFHRLFRARVGDWIFSKLRVKSRFFSTS